MKTLSTEQQNDLRSLLEDINAALGTDLSGLPPVGLNAGIKYWIMELKPKRVRKKATDESNVVDNPVQS